MHVFPVILNSPVASKNHILFKSRTEFFNINLSLQDVFIPSAYTYKYMYMYMYDKWIFRNPRRIFLIFEGHKFNICFHTSGWLHLLCQNYMDSFMLYSPFSCKTTRTFSFITPPSDRWQEIWLLNYRPQHPNGSVNCVNDNKVWQKYCYT